MSWIGPLMHLWEGYLSRRDLRRQALPFEWGLEWLDGQMPADPPAERFFQYARKALENSESFFTPGLEPSWEEEGAHWRFTTPLPSPYPANNVARVKVWVSRSNGLPLSPAVVVVPQWNADAGSHVGLCRALAAAGMTAFRLTLPYHEERRVDGLERAEYLVSPNLGRTLQAARQAVCEVRALVRRLADLGIRRIGIVGSSLGSCVAYLAFAHEPLLQTGVFNHVAASFADVVWRGEATRYVRKGLESHIDLETLRRCWGPLSPWYFIPRVCRSGRNHLLISARYDTTFLPELAAPVYARYREQGGAYECRTLPCGHYTTARWPFKYLDGWYIVNFLRRNLVRGKDA